MKKLWHKITLKQLAIFALCTHGYDILSTVIALGFFENIFREGMAIWACTIKHWSFPLTAFVITALKLGVLFLIYHANINMNVRKAVVLIYGLVGIYPCVNNTYQFVLGMVSY